MFRKKSAAPVLPPTWLIVGLGNPGPEYRSTRHNVGFDVVDRLADRNGIKVNTGRQRALVGTGTVNGEPCALAKPMTFMNVSGESVAPLARHFGLKPNRILVIADDLDLPVGRIRLREKGGSGGHNGHKSLIGALGTEEYPRIRLGIGKGGDETIDHVLSKFHPEERVDIERAITAVAKVAELVVSGSWAEAMLEVERHNGDAKD